jgi:hypothetical protein
VVPDDPLARARVHVQQPTNRLAAQHRGLHDFGDILDLDARIEDLLRQHHDHGALLAEAVAAGPFHGHAVGDAAALDLGLECLLHVRRSEGAAPRAATDGDLLRLGVQGGPELTLPFTEGLDRAESRHHSVS